MPRPTWTASAACLDPHPLHPGRPCHVRRQPDVRPASAAQPEFKPGRYHLISKTQPNVPGDFLYRLSHPLGEWVIDTGKACPTPLATVTFDVSHYPAKLSMVEAIKGQSGWLTLQHLAIDSFDTEEHLLFSAFTDSGKSLDQETCERLFHCSATVEAAGRSARRRQDSGWALKPTCTPTPPLPVPWRTTTGSFRRNENAWRSGPRTWWSPPKRIWPTPRRRSRPSVVSPAWRPRWTSRTTFSKSWCPGKETTQAAATDFRDRRPDCRKARRLDRRPSKPHEPENQDHSAVHDPVAGGLARYKHEEGSTCLRTLKNSVACFKNCSNWIRPT